MLIHLLQKSNSEWPNLLLLELNFLWTIFCLSAGISHFLSLLKEKPASQFSLTQIWSEVLFLLDEGQPLFDNFTNQKAVLEEKNPDGEVCRNSQRWFYVLFLWKQLSDTFLLIW